jgi:tRNA(fMet)-specific endonuclease VapC
VRYVLDTNTLSFLMAGEPAVAARLLAQDRTDVLVPQPVVAEIEYGLARLPDSKRRRRLRRRFEIFAEELPRATWTDEVSRTFGRVKADLEKSGTRLEDFDLAVAAHALALGATLVTDNVDHMKRIAKLELENWRDSVPPGGRDETEENTEE